MSKITSPADLQWLADRYVDRALSPSETAEFELRLANDLAACEAVASAVELRAALVASAAWDRAAAAPAVAQRKATDSSRRLTIRSLWRASVVAGLTAAAAVLVMFSAPSPQQPVADALHSGHAPREDGAALAALWAAELEESTGGAGSRGGGVSPALLTADDANPLDRSSLEDPAPWPVSGDDLTAPDWMVIAVEVADTQRGATDSPPHSEEL